MQRYLFEVTKPNRLLGVWDLEKSSINLGGLLILLAELKALMEHDGSDCKIDIAVIGERKRFQADKLEVSAKVGSILASEEHPEYEFLKFLSGMENVENIMFFDNIDSMEEHISGASFRYAAYPDKTLRERPDFEYGFTNSIKEAYEKTGLFPKLSCKHEHLHWADEFLHCFAGSKIPVALHLKNTIRKSGKPDWYNARFEHWYQFLDYANKWSNFVFILVGNESIPEEIRSLSNTIIASEHGSILIRDLALIQKADLFMGTASGPGNMAIFSSKPYVIFKTPGHHQKWVDREIIEASRLKFALESQRFLIQSETFQSLKGEFERIIRV